MKTPHIVLALLIASFLWVVHIDVPPESAQTPERVTVTYWEKWTGFEGEAMRATIDLFNRKHFRNKKGQEIFCRYLTMAEIDRKALLAIAGGHPPDLAGFWSYNTHLFADMGALTPLDEFIRRDHFDMEKYIDVYRESCQHRGVTWCLPTTPASTALHWNKDMFKAAGLDPERPPRTIKELDEYAERMTKRDENGNITQMGFLPLEPGWWNWSWGYFFGGKLNDGLETITADDPKNIEALTWVSSYAEKYGREKTLSFKQAFGTFDSPQNAFLSGKVAMVFQGVWMANFIRFHNPQMNWGCGPFPSAFDTGGEPVSVTEMDVITIPRGAGHPDEAWEVIKFINSTEGMEFLCGGAANHGGQGKQTPFKETSPGWVEQHPHPYLQVFIDLAKSKNAVSTPKVAVWNEYQLELAAAFDRVWLGQQTPAAALKEVQARMQSKLDKILAADHLRHPGGELPGVIHRRDAESAE